jgi:hypothetical protein
MYISRYHILLILCCVAFILLSGCTSEIQASNGTRLDARSTGISSSDSGVPWMTTPITDVESGKDTTIAELQAQGKPIIMHLFAVWCPACSTQLRESTRLIQNNPGSYILLPIDIDPRENADLVRKHIKKNNFEGTFIIAPQDFTRSLANTIGGQIGRSFPQTVIIYNQSVTYIGDGAFSEERLKTILDQLPS